ncbi:uncharacterized protein AKAW2_80617A [Aspergillus luchuensis]|uniref:Uncharacterized protein n=1 Tax=Aspergillus kawachii TaxID=1069201 RepID=A0A7R7WKS7_ASPKA|nr:uncharacterized protein AKAW2_80617A [Aspergillus luchuensis]BCS04816.1 hypothetical protein AKAW2_80617A [Aspergillus luchuensis]
MSSPKRRIETDVMKMYAPFPVSGTDHISFNSGRNENAISDMGHINSFLGDLC